MDIPFYKIGIGRPPVHCASQQHVSLCCLYPKQQVHRLYSDIFLLLNYIEYHGTLNNAFGNKEDA